MSNQDRVHRDVVIANRTYPLKIYKSDEEKILSIVKTVNQKIEQLKTVYDAKDNQDYLAMCILQMYAQSSSQNAPDHPAIDIEPQLQKIEALINNAPIE